MRAARATIEKTEPHPAIAARGMIDTSDICWMFSLKVAIETQQQVQRHEGMGPVWS